MLKRLVVTVIFLFSINAFAEPASIKVEKSEEGLKINVMSEGEVCAGCKVFIKKESGEDVVSGRTNDSGLFLVEDVPVGKLFIKAENPVGGFQEIEYTVLPSVAEFVEKKDVPVLNKAETVPDVVNAEDKNILKADKIRKIIAEEIAELKTENLEQKSTPLELIIAGVGYIFGIFGFLSLIIVNVRSVRPIQRQKPEQKSDNKKSGFFFNRKTADKKNSSENNEGENL